MSKITVTADNVDKFIKRFHKNAGKEFGKTLAESQELFSKSLGSKNYHELKKILAVEEVKKTSVIENKFNIPSGMIFKDLISYIISTEVKEDFNSDDMSQVAKRFYKRLMAILNTADSKIKLAFYSKRTLFFYSVYGDCYTFSFQTPFENINLDSSWSFNDKIRIAAQEKGLSGTDSDYLGFLFKMFSYPHVNQLFFFKELNENLEKIIKSEFAKEQHEYILKKGEVGDIKVIGEDIYYEDTCHIKKDFVNAQHTRKVIENKTYIQLSKMTFNAYRQNITEFENSLYIKVYYKREDNSILIEAT